MRYGRYDPPEWDRPNPPPGPPPPPKEQSPSKQVDGIDWTPLVTAVRLAMKWGRHA